jgi:hypothetical protein
MKQVILYFAVTLIASVLLAQGGKGGAGGKGGMGGGGTAAVSLSFASTNASHVNGSSTSDSLGTASVGDIVHYATDADSATAVFTVTLTGSCAASGGVVVDKSGPAYNSNFMQAGHFVITTGGACSVNSAWTVAADGWLAVARITGATVLDSVAALNDQNVLSGTNTWCSGTGSQACPGSGVTTSLPSACIGYAISSSFGGGTLTAGTLNGTAWALGTNSPVASPGPFGEETVIQGSAGAITASFSNTSNAFPYIGISCYH